MTLNDWNETATGVAGYVQKFRLFIERGAVPLQLYKDQNAPAQEDWPLVAVFGNDNELGCPATREIELVRKQVHDAALHEVGFGVSADGSSWALLVGKDQQFQTAAGRAFEKELLKIFLEDAVWRAWHKASE